MTCPCLFKSVALARVDGARFVAWRARADDERPTAVGTSTERHWLDGEHDRQVDAYAAIVPAGVARGIADEVVVVAIDRLVHELAPRSYCCVDVVRDGDGFAALLVPADALRSFWLEHPAMAIAIGYSDQRVRVPRTSHEPFFISKSGSLRVSSCEDGLRAAQ